MKTIKFILIITLLAAVGINTSAQAGAKAAGQQKTDTFKVLGKCDMCKERIESTVKAEGATSAEWDQQTQMLAVTYNTSKTSKDALCKKLALVGHDNEKYKATDDAYAKLPSCCHYDRTK